MKNIDPITLSQPGLAFALGCLLSISATPFCHAACLPEPAALVGWWRAEGNGTDTIMGNHASATPAFSFATGYVGQAFDFNGNTRVIIPDNPNLDFGTGDFSVEAWIRPLLSVTDYGVMAIVNKRFAPNVAQSLGYEFALVDGRLTFRLSDSIADNGQVFGQAGPDLRDGKFHHVAVCVARNSTTGGRLSIDGVSVLTFDPTAESGSITTSEPLRIGNHATYFLNCFFKGQIDEVSLYKRALSPSEIANLYAAASDGKCLPLLISQQPQSQVGYWGKNVTFNVVATGEPPLSYQWFKDGQPIPNATDSSLVLTNLQMADAGTYTVTITNPTGTTTSAPALLTMNPAGVSLALYAGVTIEGVQGLTYGIQSSTNLNDVNGWRGRANVTLAGPTQFWLDLQPSSFPQHYYRVVPGPIPIP